MLKSNPFLEADFSKFMDPSKMMSELKMPGFDAGTLIDAHRKNMESLQTGNQAIMQSLQLFAQRQADLMRQSMEATAAMMNTLISSSSASAKAASPVGAFKAAT